MTNNFCALCADLIEAVLSDDSHIDCTEIARRARAALGEADEPAVPEVVGSEWQPCVKLPITVHVREQRPGEQHVSTREGITPVQSDDLIMLGVAGEEYPIGRELFQRTYRMGSADEPAVPEGREPAAVVQEPSDAELVSKLVEAASGAAAMGWDHHAQRILRAAELLQRQALVPVPVAERPWEREGWCDELGRCWLGRPDTGDWSADWTLATPEAIAEFCEFSPQTVCLPAHALPLPEAGE